MPILAALLCYAFAPNTAHATLGQEECRLPVDLKWEVVQKYPGSRVVEITDLSTDDKKLFEKDHGTQCPGLVKIDFYGDGRPTWALVLLDASKRKANLVIAHKVERWAFQLLESSDVAPVPVVWRDKSGKYQDVYGEKTLTAPHPVIVFCGYESWAIVYAWAGSKAEKVWISD